VSELETSVPYGQADCGRFEFVGGLLDWMPVYVAEQSVPVEVVDTAGVVGLSATVEWFIARSGQNT